MHSQDNNSERGQAIVYLVLGLVVFFGFVALAIDGGMVLANRRHVQNASDAASLAGGAAAGLYLKQQQDNTCRDPWTCTDSYVVAAMGRAEASAIDRAAENGFDIDISPTDHDGVVSTACDAILGNPYMDVTVQITDTSPSNFLQIISPQTLRNKVQAVTRVYLGGPEAMGNAVVALNPNGCGSESGAVFKGTGDLGVSGGGVWSNGCLQGAGQPSITVADPRTGEFYAYSGEFDAGNAAWTPQPPASPKDYVLPSYTYEIGFDTSDCSVWDYVIPNDADDLEGLYCYHGDFNINNNQVITGTNVTFYVEGDVKLNGGATVWLAAPTTDNHDGTIPGVLFYVPKLVDDSACYDQTVDLEGNNETHIEGLVYAPCSKVTLTGTEDSFMVNSQIVAWDVKVAGTANTTITYDGCNGYMVSPYIELYK